MSRREMLSGPPGLRLLVAAVAFALIGAVPVSGAGTAAAPTAQAPTTYLVGAASVSIDVDDGGTFAGEPVHIGGGGMGQTEDRTADPGLRAHAVVIAATDDAADAFVLGLVDDFGHFAAYEQGPYGLVDIRRRAAGSTGIDPQQIMLQGSHSHRAPDTLGLWGGVPEEYLAHVADRTVAAIEQAWQNIEPAALWVGEVHAPGLQLNDYAGAPGNGVVDRGVRVLQARRDDGSVVATLSNLSAHPIASSGLDAFHPDWPGEAAAVSADRFGGGGFGMVGAIGRIAPNRGPSAEACDPPPPGTETEACRSAHYSGLLLDAAERALRAAEPLTGPARVEGHSYLFTDVSTNPVPQALFYSPEETGLALYRSTDPPWQYGTATSTIAAVAKVGEVAFVGVPGEIFPSIFAAVEDLVPATEHFAVGLANDMLGYIVHPFPDAYPEVLRRVAFQGDPNDPTAWEQGSDDKFLFNLSFTFGEQLTCNLLRGFGEIDDAGLDYWDAYGGCAPFTADLVRPAGADVDGTRPQSESQQRRRVLADLSRR